MNEHFKSFGLGAENKPDPNNRRCILYTRVSTKEQADKNCSLEVQMRTCKEFALRQKYDIVAEFGGKHESARTNANRKEFDAMVAFAKKKSNRIRFIVVFSYDRFSREGASAMYLKEQLKKQGVFIISATQPLNAETTTGSVMEDFQLLISKADNEMRRDKCIAGMRERLRQGKWTGSTPTGYSLDKNSGELVINETGRMLQKAFKWKLKEPNLSNEEIRKKLSSHGCKISKSLISRIFHNPFYCGMMAHGVLEGEVVPGKHPPIVSREDFLTIHNIQLSSNAHGWKQNEVNDDLPLKRFMKCATCGTPLTGYLNPKGIHYYKCRKKGCYSNKNAEHLAVLFKNMMSWLEIRDCYQAELVCEIKAYTGEAMRERVEEVKGFEARLAELNQKIARLEARYVIEEAISQEQFEKFHSSLSKERNDLSAKLEESRQQSSNLMEHLEEVVSYALNLPKLWDSGDYRTRQLIQQMVFPDGMEYDKKSDAVLTPMVNEVFRVIAQIGQQIAAKKERRAATLPPSSSWVHP